MPNQVCYMHLMHVFCILMFRLRTLLKYQGMTAKIWQLLRLQNNLIKLMLQLLKSSMLCRKILTILIGNSLEDPATLIYMF